MHVASVHANTAKAWQQRGMGIDDAACEVRENAGAELLQVTSEYDKVDVCHFQHGIDRLIQRRGINVRRAAQMRNRNTVLTGALCRAGI